jgi:hypothetical protein
MAKEIPVEQLAQRLDEATIETFTNLSVVYAQLYKENPKAFINAFRKFKSIRMASAFIVQVYRSQGIMREVKEVSKDFSKYAEKYFDGPTAKVFGDILSIIYAISR